MRLWGYLLMLVLAALLGLAYLSRSAPSAASASPSTNLSPAEASQERAGEGAGEDSPWNRNEGAVRSSRRRDGGPDQVQVFLAFAGEQPLPRIELDGSATLHYAEGSGDVFCVRVHNGCFVLPIGSSVEAVLVGSVEVAGVEYLAVSPTPHRSTDGRWTVELALPSGLRTLEVLTRETGQRIPQPLCVLPSSDLPSSARGPESGREPNARGNDGILEVPEDFGGPWLWVGARGHQWRRVYLGLETSRTKVVFLDQGSDVRVLLRGVPDPSRLSDFQVSLADESGFLLNRADLEYDPSAPQRLVGAFSAVAPGRYYLAASGRSVRGKREQVGLAVLDVKGSGQQVALVEYSDPETGRAYELSGTLVFPLGDNLWPGGRYGYVEVLSVAPDLGRMGTQGPFLSSKLRAQPVGSDGIWTFGPVSLHEGTYVLSTVPPLHTWSVDLHRDMDIVVEVPETELFHLEVVDEDSGVPVKGALVSWGESEVEGLEVPQGIRTRRRVQSCGTEGELSLPRPEGPFTVSVAATGYADATLEVLEGEQYQRAQLKRLPVLEVQLNGGPEDPLLTDLDWIAKAMLGERDGGVVVPTRIRMTERRGLGSGAGGDKIIAIQITIPHEGEFKLLVPRSAPSELQDLAAFNCKASDWTEIQVKAEGK